MIHALGVELQAQLRAKGCPVRVADGPEPAPRDVSWANERIVVENDPNGDRFGGVKSQHGNPKQVATCQVGVRITIYAKAPSAAATFEHRERAEHIRDLVIAALKRIAPVNCTLGGGRHVPIDDLAKSEIEAGAKYELLVTFDRGIEERTWKGDARPEMTLGAGQIRSTTKVSRQGADDDGDPTTIPAGAETACGG